MTEKDLFSDRNENVTLNSLASLNFLYFSISITQFVFLLVSSFCSILFLFKVAAGRKAFQENIRKKKVLAQFPEDICKRKGKTIK